MSVTRRLIAQRRLAMLICAATLLLKLLVPAGYMLGSDHGRVTATLCSGMAPDAMAAAMPGMHDGKAGHGNSRDHGKAEAPCAFSGLAAAALGAIDPVQLAVLIAFVMTLAFAAVVLPAPLVPAHLRPPLRGPPATT